MSINLTSSGIIGTNKTRSYSNINVEHVVIRSELFLAGLWTQGFSSVDAQNRSRNRYISSGDVDFSVSFRQSKRDRREKQLMNKDTIFFSLEISELLYRSLALWFVPTRPRRFCSKKNKENVGPWKSERLRGCQNVKYPELIFGNSGNWN